MDPDIKKEMMKFFHIASFLFITIFFVLPYLIQVSTYFHEKSHQKMLDRFGVENNYDLNILDTIHNFYNPNVKKLGVTTFNVEQYRKLDRNQKTNINIAGVISDLRFIFLISIYLALLNVYMFYKVRVKKEYNLTWSLAVNWILFMWLLALVQITVSNITYMTGDLFHLVSNLC